MSNDSIANIHNFVLMSIRKIIGQNLKGIRMSKGWSQEKLAYTSRLSFSFVSALERGAVNVSADSLEKLAKALKIEVEDLVKKAK